MKVVHSKKTGEESAEDWLSNAKKLEKDGDFAGALAVYEKLLHEKPLNQYAYYRLMIIYRKNKDYKKELETIKKGMQSFENFFKENSRLQATKKITTLSKSLLKSLDIAGQKENPLHLREPLYQWNKRKAVVERLLKR